jgi:hypothetical protein
MRPAMIRELTGANQVPARADATMFGGAPKKANHAGPPKTAPMWIITPAIAMSMAKYTHQVLVDFMRGAKT